MPAYAPPFGRRSPTASATRNETNGNSTIAGAKSSIPAILPPHRRRLCDVDVAEVAVQHQDDPDTDRDLGGGERHHEQPERLPRDVPPDEGERDEVDVRGVQQQFDRHQEQQRVAPRQDAEQSDTEDGRGEEQVVLRRDHPSSPPPNSVRLSSRPPSARSVRPSASASRVARCTAPSSATSSVTAIRRKATRKLSPA